MPIFLIQEKYFTALEVAQKSVDAIFQRDKKMINQLLDLLGMIPENLQEYHEIVEFLVSANFAQLSQRFPMLTSNPYVVSWRFIPTSEKHAGV